MPFPHPATRETKCVPRFPHREDAMERKDEETERCAAWRETVATPPPCGQASLIRLRAEASARQARYRAAGRPIRATGSPRRGARRERKRQHRGMRAGFEINGGCDVLRRNETAVVQWKAHVSDHQRLQFQGSYTPATGRWCIVWFAFSMIAVMRAALRYPDRAVHNLVN